MAPAQTQPPRASWERSAAFKAETAEIEIKPDNGEAVALKVTADTIAQKVAPGVTDLKKAEAIKVTDVALGDRVLATPEPGTTQSAPHRRDVGHGHREEERSGHGWIGRRRGVTGMVAAKSGNEVTLKIRTLGGESQAVVTVTDKTRFKRYAPDSVKFAEARSSKLAEISVGDQVRARGVKSEDGLKGDCGRSRIRHLRHQGRHHHGGQSGDPRNHREGPGQQQAPDDPHHGRFADQEDARHGRHDGRHGARRYGQRTARLRGGGLRRRAARRDAGMGGGRGMDIKRCWNACLPRSWKI